MEVMRKLLPWRRRFKQEKKKGALRKDISRITFLRFKTVSNSRCINFLSFWLSKKYFILFKIFILIITNQGIC